MSEATQLLEPLCTLILMALCRVLVGLPDVDVLTVIDATDTSPMVVEVASILDRPDCRAPGHAPAFIRPHRTAAGGGKGYLNLDRQVAADLPESCPESEQTSGRDP